MDSSARIRTELQRVFANDQLDDEGIPETRSEMIEEIIEAEGWEPVQDYLLDVLKNDSAPYRDWESAAEAFWGAALDKRAVQSDLVIALLYLRLKPDEHSDENNLAWSIVCKLKGIGYHSEYDPMADPDIQAALNSLTKQGVKGNLH